MVKKLLLTSILLASSLVNGVPHKSKEVIIENNPKKQFIVEETKVSSIEELRQRIKESKGRTRITLEEGKYTLDIPIDLKSNIELDGSNSEVTIRRDGFLLYGTREEVKKPKDGLYKVFDNSVRYSHEPEAYSQLEHFVNGKPKEELKLKYNNKSFIKINPIENVSIHNFNLIQEKDKSAKTIDIRNALNCCISNCNFGKSRWANIWARDSKDLSFYNNKMSEGYDYSYGSYGLVLDGCTDTLISNNRFRKLRHSIVLKNGTNGSYIINNISRENNPQKNKDDACDISFHGGFPYMNTLRNNSFQFAHSADYFGKSGIGNIIENNIIEGKGVIISLGTEQQIVRNNIFKVGNIWVGNCSKGSKVYNNTFFNKSKGKKSFIYENERLKLYNE